MSLLSRTPKTNQLRTSLFSIVVATAAITAAHAQQATILHPQNFAVSQALRDLAPPADDSEQPLGTFPEVLGASTTKLLNFDGAGRASSLSPDPTAAPGPPHSC